METDTSGPQTLRVIALYSLLAGAAGSLFLTICQGRHNSSVVLVTLFVLWVLSPFAGLLAADRMTRGRSASSRSLMYWLMIGLAMLSIIVYSGILAPASAKPAFVFLIFPLISWLFIIIIFAIARRRS